MTFSYSVVIPAFNAAKTIEQAIDSILRQTLPAEEIIVVDDGSTDGTAALVGGIAGPITVIRQENRGPSSTSGDSGTHQGVGPGALSRIGSDFIPFR